MHIHSVRNIRARVQAQRRQQCGVASRTLRHERAAPAPQSKCPAARVKWGPVGTVCRKLSEDVSSALAARWPERPHNRAWIFCMLLYQSIWGRVYSPRCIPFELSTDRGCNLDYRT